MINIILSYMKLFDHGKNMYNNIVIDNKCISQTASGFIMYDTYGVWCLYNFRDWKHIDRYGNEIRKYGNINIIGELSQSHFYNKLK